MPYARPGAPAAARPLAWLAFLGALVPGTEIRAGVPFTTLDAQAPPAATRSIILSFDDGPGDDGVTAGLLDVLEKHRVEAVFFFVGRNVAKHPELAARAARSGHQIGIHSWDAEWPPWSDAPALRAEIARARQTIEEATGVSLPAPLLYRPPRGIVTPAVDHLRDSCEVQVGHLTFYARDSAADGADAERILQRTRAGLRKHDGGAIVFHSTRYRADPIEDDGVDKRWLPSAVDSLITWALAEGFTFRTYPRESGSPCPVPS